MKQVAMKRILKKNRDVSGTIATPKTELFVALVSDFELLTSFTKNSTAAVTRVLNSPLEYYNLFGNL